MRAHPELLHALYRAFNVRDIDTALACMHPDVDWPNGMEGGRVIGHGEVRAYWTRQWGMIDPHVEPLAFVQEDSGRTAVTVHQVVGEPDCSGRALRRALYSGMPDETLSLAGSRSR